MAKFFVTNNKDWYQQTKERISNSDYSLAFDYAKDGIFALTTHKLKINNKNAYENSKGDFVIATGTAIYKESLDYSNASDDFVREELMQGGVKYVRNNTIGQYAYVIKSHENISVFGDGFGAYNIYYFQKGSYYYISNFLYDMACVLREEISLNEMNLLEYSVQRAILCNETLFHEIKRLNGKEYIYIESKEDKLQIKSTSKTNCIIRDDAKVVAQKLAEKLAYKASVIANVLGNPSICMTGGLDSRMSLAAYLKAGVKPTLSFAVSNTQIASPEQKDIEIIRVFSEKFSLKDNIYDCDTRFPEKEWNKYLRKYGFLNIWGAAEDVMIFFENMQEAVCTCGYGGELFRNVNLTENRVADITIDELVDEYYMRLGKAKLEKYNELRQHIKEKLIKIAIQYNLDSEHLKPGDIAYFFMEYRAVADSIAMNFLNCLRYSNMLLMESDIVECSRIPNREMDGAKFMLRILNDLYPAVLEVPIFSHHKLHSYDSQKMVLYSGLDAKRPLLIIRMKDIYKRFSTILKPVRDLYKFFEKKSWELVPQVEEDDLIKEEKSPIFGENMEVIISFDNVNLAVYHAMNLKAINAIFKS